MIHDAVSQADLIVGAVLVPGASAPRLVTRSMLKDVPNGAVIVDVAVDQGGCIETTHPTTHSDPTYYVEGVLHYCVANMPGAVPRTSTFALTNATLPYALRLANRGFFEAIAIDAGLKAGVNTYAGQCTMKLATSQGLKYTPLDELIGTSAQRRPESPYFLVSSSSAMHSVRSSADTGFENNASAYPSSWLPSLRSIPLRRIIGM